MHGSARWNVCEESSEGVGGDGAEAGRNTQECSEPAISHESLGVLGMHGQRRNGENGHAGGDAAGRQNGSSHALMCSTDGTRRFRKLSKEYSKQILRQ